MSEVAQTGWTSVLTRTGRYEYQFQGHVPGVRNGKYEDARDYQFLVMDEERWLYRIPVRMAAEAEAELRKSVEKNQDASGPAALDEVLRVAAAQLRAGLENYRPWQSAPYEELDSYFAVDLARARELSGTAGA
jgi:hypothetical protein